MPNIIVIPARLASTRLPEKLLLDLRGKSILQRVYERASLSKLADQVCIATDNERIFAHATRFCKHTYMTSPEHQSGTDRIAELAAKNHDWKLIVNVQGDEPFINPEDIDKLFEVFLHDPKLQMASMFHKIDDLEEINNPNNVKVVTDANNYAMYFSRAAIPYVRDGQKQSAGKEQFNAAAGQKPCAVKKHIGIYAYSRDLLLMLSKLPKTKLEALEKLEQLRALENGIKIKMLETNYKPIGIDTREDYEEALRHCERSEAIS
jgi:3-deoxy-manno-octulosonate cytidylyltransferase (CMP-KDO synthetase)